MYVIRTEIFRIFPAPLDFSHSYRNIELFIVILRAEPEISKKARSGNSSVFEDFLGLMVSFVLCYSYGVLKPFVADFRFTVNLREMDFRQTERNFIRPAHTCLKFLHVMSGVFIV